MAHWTSRNSEGTLLLTGRHGIRARGRLFPFCRNRAGVLDWVLDSGPANTLAGCLGGNGVGARCAPGRGLRMRAAHLPRGPPVCLRTPTFLRSKYRTGANAESPLPHLVARKTETRLRNTHFPSVKVPDWENRGKCVAAPGSAKNENPPKKHPISFGQSTGLGKTRKVRCRTW